MVLFLVEEALFEATVEIFGEIKDRCNNTLTWRQVRTLQKHKNLLMN